MSWIPVPVLTIGLLIASNVFMTFAWYGHLKYKTAPLVVVILVSWGIALFEYVLQVPANRIGHGYFSAAQLKTIQEVITLSVFTVFSWAYLGFGGRPAPDTPDAASTMILVVLITPARTSGRITSDAVVG